MKKQRDKFIDDGRVVAPMNVAGMPWYDRGAKKAADDGKTPGEGPSAAGCGPETRRPGPQAGGQVRPSKKETFAMLRGVLLAALTVAAVFAVGFWLFILFCQNLWLR